jgi:hypothetical protein
MRRFWRASGELRVANHDHEAAPTVSEGGMASDHPAAPERVAHVAPSTAAGFNVLRLIFSPIACWRVEDIRFEFDSSLVRPAIAREMVYLDALRTQHRGAPVSIFGHADPVGRDDYNKRLSGRRAAAIYGLLTRKTGIWETLYSSPHGHDNWGTRSIQIMLDNLSYSPGTLNGTMNVQTRDAIQRFQRAHGLPDSGNVTADTRKKLFEAYMDNICRDMDGTPFRLADSDFLGGGADAKGRGDYQGCSEFNPVLVFSDDEHRAYEGAADKSERNAENAPNRRVILFLFRPGTRIDLNWWPCPAADEGTAKCEACFFSDAETRRGNQAVRRRYEDTKDTFACIFYDRLSDRSPCEAPAQIGPSILFVDEIGLPVKNSPVKLRLADGQQLVLTTDNEGKVYPGLAAGTRFHAELPNIHEASSGQSTRTPSGQHFSAGGSGP